MVNWAFSRWSRGRSEHVPRDQLDNANLVDNGT